ncbi:uncharacterized protein (DUF1501 family) [Streptomyces sp. V4I8]|uniref:DUF1501 domain-containing protein n=1 Tax=Streptomyces sp. V4I8 TaxID=3156469 RepID=UPI003514124B
MHPLQARAATSLGDLTKVATAFGKEDGHEDDHPQDPAEPPVPPKPHDPCDKDAEKPTAKDRAGEDSAKGASAGGQGQLGRQLAVVAKAITAGVPTRAYSVSLGGFDTHSNEKGTQSQLLGQMDRDISAFLDEMRRTPAGRRVVVAVYSEFGRRVKANASDGTDHGTAGPVFILGERVKGGFYGEQPSLRKLDNGDMFMTTDFRDVYATLLERVLDTDPGKVLYGHNKTLDFI